MKIIHKSFLNEREIVSGDDLDSGHLPRRTRMREVRRRDARLFIVSVLL